MLYITYLYTDIAARTVARTILLRQRVSLVGKLARPVQGHLELKIINNFF